MALKTGLLFKGFNYNQSSSGNGFSLSPFFTHSFNYKGDNNATRVDLFVEDPSFNIFDYKYLTFDNKTIFEITNVIVNNNVYTVFYQYLSCFNLGSIITDFKPTRQTPSTLKKLKWDISKWIEVAGNIDYFKQYAPKLNYEPLGFMIKVECSDFPQNLRHLRLNDSRTHYVTTGSEIPANTRGRLGHLTANNERIDTALDFPPASVFQGSQTSVSFLIPVPMIINDNITKERGILRINNYDFYLYYNDFIRTLSALISDLTLSIEVIPIGTEPTIGSMENVNGVSTLRQVYYEGDGVFFFSKLAADGVYNNLLMDGAVLSLNIPMASGTPYPILCLQVGLGGNSTPSAGFVEYFNFIHIQQDLVYPNYTKATEVMFNFLGNTFDVGNAEILYLKTKPHGLRLYLDYELQNYTDFPNSLEFDKSAFSNYEAYTKSNIELLNRQNAEQLKLQQKYEEKQFQVNQFKTFFGGLSDTMTRGAIGNLKSGVTAGINNIATLAFSDYEYELKVSQQNEQLDLNNIQALERARSTIVAGTVINGTILLENLFYVTKDLNGNVIRSPYFYYYVDIIDTAKTNKVYNEIIKGHYTDITYENIVTPNYRNNGDLFLCYFEPNFDTTNIGFYALVRIAT